jgi:hypothetical protein
VGVTPTLPESFDPGAFPGGMAFVILRVTQKAHS